LLVLILLHRVHSSDITLPKQGRPELPISEEDRKERQRESTKKSRQNYQKRIQQHLNKLREDFSAEVKKLSLAEQHDRKRLAKLAAPLITKALESKDAAAAQAVKRFQRQPDTRVRK
jgi:signal recognition particle GTPase